MSATVTLSVVSHGQAKLVQQLLNHLAAVDAPTLQWVVLTLNLPEPPVHIPPSLQGRSLTVHNDRPAGFAANHNAAFAHCQTEWFAVVNPDICLSEDVFSRLLARAQPGDAVLAPALFDPRSGKVARNRGLLTPWEILRRRLRRDEQAGAQPVWLPGAFMLIRSEAFRAVGGFDTRYFLYVEDFDLCARLRLAGWNLRYVPEVQVSHAAQRHSHVRWRYLRWHVASLLRLWRSPVFWRYRALLRQEARAAHASKAHRPR